MCDSRLSPFAQNYIESVPGGMSGRSMAVPRHSLYTSPRNGPFPARLTIEKPPFTVLDMSSTEYDQISLGGSGAPPPRDRMLRPWPCANLESLLSFEDGKLEPRVRTMI